MSIDLDAIRRMQEDGQGCHEIGVLLDEVDRLTAALHNSVFGPPAQMSYAGRLVPINSTGMRQVVDDASRYRAERDELREILRRLEMDYCGSFPGCKPGCACSLAAARRVLGDTPNPETMEEL